MDRTRFARMLRRAAVAAIALVLAVTLSLPVWFPWLLGPVARHYGVRYETYDRVGYWHLALGRVEIRARGVLVKVQRLETGLPTVWMWRRVGLGAHPMIAADGWEVHVAAAQPETQAPRSPLNSVADILNTVASGLPHVRTWVSSASLNDGAVVLTNATLKVASVEWDGRRVRASLASESVGQTVLVDLDLAERADWRVSARAEPLGVSVQARIVLEGQDWKTEGEVLWQGNRGRFTSAFAPGQWPPSHARLDLANLRVPAEMLRWESYDALTGSVHLTWADNQLRIQAHGHADPLDIGAPPIELALTARGNARGAMVETLDVNTPWVQASLSDPFRVERGMDKWQATPALLRVQCDLDTLPLGGARGRVVGSARIEPSAQPYPRVVVSVTGEGLFAMGMDIQSGAMDATLDWPLLHVGAAHLAWSDRSTATAGGTIDLSSNTVEEGTWAVQGPVALRFLPAEVRYNTLDAQGTCHGAWPNLVHTGRVTATGVRIPYSAAMQVRARWQGEGPDIPDVEIQVDSNDTSMEGIGSIRVGQDTVLRLDRWVCRQGGREIIRLATPSQVSFRAPGYLALEGMNLEGDGCGLNLAGSVVWPSQGLVQVRASGLRLRDFEGWVAKRPPDASVDELALEAAWDRGPLTLSARARGQYARNDGPLISGSADVVADAMGLDIEAVSLTGEGTEAVTLRGHIPVAIVPMLWPRPFDERARERLSLEAVVRPNPLLSGLGMDLADVNIVAPDVRLTVSGSLMEPLARIEASAKRIELGTRIQGSLVPTIDRVHVDAEVEAGRATLRTLTFEVEGQAVLATGQCPIPSGYWAGILGSPSLPDWRTATGQLSIEGARLDAFKKQLGAWLLPQGLARAEMTLRTGGRVEGRVSLADAAIRPLGPMAAIRDIEAEVRFEDRSAVVDKGTATIGGQPVTLNGWTRWTDPNHPEFEFALKGSNVPLVREAGLVLRSDVDLRVVQTQQEPARVTGQMVLRDSLFLRDLKVLVPSSKQRPEDRPPYFSVADRPFADWRLDLRVGGDRFLRVRTPWFTGEISADFKVQGTLREPVSIGEARIGSGLVRFPFADFSVDRGLVEITRTNPYQPILDVAATSRSYGYTLKLALTGPASRPVLLFSSTPALSSEAILLFVTAGELPKGGATMTPQQRAGQMAGFFALDLLRRINPEEGATDRLTIRSGEEVSETGQPTRYIEYLLDDRWSVYGEYDRFNQLNAGLKWRLYSK